MKILIYLIALFLIAGFFSCGEKADEMKEAMKVLQNAPEIAKKAEEAQKSMTKADEKLKERRAKGDTLAMHYSKLQEYLPKSISGYEAEDPTGETANYGMYSFSTAGIKFKKSGGSDNIKIQLVDYNAAYGMYSGLTVWAAMGISIDNDQKYEKTFDPGIHDAVAYEEFNKKNKDAKVTYALGYRFLLTIEASNQNGTDYIKGVANSMNLKNLASM